MATKHTVQIQEFSETSTHEAPTTRVVFQQTLDNLDISKLVQFINSAPPKRVYKSKAKVEAAR